MRWMVLAHYAIAGMISIGVPWLARTSRITLNLQTLPVWQAVFVGVLALGLFTTLFKRIRSRLFWEGVFTLTVFLGVWFLLLFALPFGWALAFASALTLLQIFFPFVILHNLFYLVGCVGVAMNFAGWLASDVLLFGLVLFSLYDTVAGPPGGAIEVLAAKLVSAGIVPGLVIPGRIRDLRLSLDKVTSSNVALLGAGDVILPLTLVVKAAIHGPAEGAAVLVGLLIGAGVLGQLSDSHPRAAVPILAAGAAIPFVILRAFSWI